MYTSSISAGCAFYPDCFTAIWKGICEVVERDSMMRFWYLKFGECKKINISSLTTFDICERIRRIREKDLEIFLFEISSVIKEIPTVFCVIKGIEFPYYVCGVSTNTDIVSAITKAIDEAISLRFMAKWNGAKKMNFNDFSGIRKLEDHLDLYANWENCPVFEKLLNGQHQTLEGIDSVSDIDFVNPPTNKSELKQIAKTFKSKGFDIYYKDITMPELLQVGHVVRVVIPQMIPLSQNYYTRWLATIVPDRNKLSEINSYPQPFS